MKKELVAFSILFMLVGCGNETKELANEDIKIEEKRVEEADVSSAGEESPDSTNEVESDNKTKRPSNNRDNDDETTTLSQDEYVKKLDEVRTGLADFEEVLENGTQVEMTEAQGEIFKRWDRALNEIYGVLEKQLPANDMSRLREEQRKWITYRDDKAKEEALPFEGGTMQSLQYISTQTRITEERCYELVESYME